MPLGGEGVAVRPGHAPDQAMQAESAEIVGHRAGGVGGQVAAEQGSDQRTEVTVAEAAGQVSEAAAAPGAAPGRADRRSAAPRCAGRSADGLAVAAVRRMTAAGSSPSATRSTSKQFAH